MKGVPGSWVNGQIENVFWIFPLNYNEDASETQEVIVSLKIGLLKVTGQIII